MATETSAAMNQSKRREEKRKRERDIISNLPKHILASILSLIPIKEAATTSILSKSWRHIWNSIPHLRIQGIMEDGSDDIDKWLAAFHSILMAHKDPIESCYISIPFYVHFDARLEACLDNFINFLAERSIRSLSIVPLRCDFRIPRQAFFLQSLQELTLQNCEVVPPPFFRGLPSLKILELVNVNMSCDDFSRMVCLCPALEMLEMDQDILVLEMNQAIMEDNFRIDAPNLLYLKFSTIRAQDISLENAPLLAHVSLRILDDGDTFEINSFVNLLMKLDNVETLAIDFDVYQLVPREQMPQSLPSQHQLQKLKKLHLEIAYIDSKAVVFCLFFLRSCPILEEFSLRAFNPELDPDEIDYLEDETPLECLMHHLTTVHVLYPHPNRQYIHFIKFLLMNTHVLKRMVIRHDVEDPQEAKSIVKELNSFQRVSPNAVLLFKLC